MCIQFTLSIFYVMLHVKVFKFFFVWNRRGTLSKLCTRPCTKRCYATGHVPQKRSTGVVIFDSFSGAVTQSVNCVCVCVCFCVSLCFDRNDLSCRHFACWFVLQLFTLPHSMRSRIYETVQRPSIRPSVCPIDRQQQRRAASLQLSTLWAGDIDRQRRAPALSSMRAVSCW